MPLPKVSAGRKKKVNLSRIDKIAALAEKIYCTRVSKAIGFIANSNGKYTINRDFLEKRSSIEMDLAFELARNFFERDLKCMK